LPADGATARAEGVWTDATELLAGIVEELDAHLRLTYQAASGKRASWKPLRVPRPRPEGSLAKRQPTPDELLSLFGLRRVPNRGG
jgi:hypothetical protein